jgi:hypothetical protein
MVQIRKMIQDISSERVVKANELIGAYHKKAEASLESMTSATPSGERLIELDDYDKAQAKSASKFEEQK